MTFPSFHSRMTWAVLAAVSMLLEPRAHAQDSRINGRIIIDLHYTEKDSYADKSKDSIGEDTHNTVNETAIEFHNSQTVQIIHDSEGLSFLVLDDPQKVIRGSVTHTVSGRSTHHSFPDGPDYPTDITTERGQATGKADETQFGGANLTTLNEGKDLMLTIPSILQITDSSYRKKTITHHWEGNLGNTRKLKEDVISSDVGQLPGKGATESPGFTLRPAATVLPEGLRPDPSSDFESSIWFGAKTVKLPKGGYVITCNGTISDPRAEEESHSASAGKSIAHSHTKTINATITIIPGPRPPADLVIEPVDSKAYDDWLPKPFCDDATTQAIYGDAESIAIKATLKPKDPSKPVAGAPMDFYLTEVSKHRGRCGNEPKSAATDTNPKPGLRFAKNQGPGIHVDPDNPQHAYVISDVTEATVVIEAIDAGAYGKLQATADTYDLVGVYQRTGGSFISIPRDDNGNHVADAWEKQNHILDKNYLPTWDEDNKPDTGPSNKGDGLTLYEEYRGFVTGVNLDPNHEQAAWQRLPPEVKKIFVYPQGDDTLLFKAGSRLYESVTGTKVYFIHDENGVAKDDLGTTRYVTRWFNFNSNTDDGVDFKGRQFAVVIQNDNNAHIFTKSAPNLPDVDVLHRAPEQVEAVHINRHYVEQAIDSFINSLPPNRNVVPYPPIPSARPPAHAISIVWMEANFTLKQKGIDVHLESIGYRMKEHRRELVDQYITFSTMHELGHATGAIHHGLIQSLSDSAENENKYYSAGDVGCAMRYWDTDERTVVDNFELRLRFFAGLWNPAASAPDGQSWHFCDKEDCKPGMHLIKK